MPERALYCFESSFHTLFNIAHGNCRLNYCQAENRYRHTFLYELMQRLVHNIFALGGIIKYES